MADVVAVVVVGSTIIAPAVARDEAISDYPALMQMPRLYFDGL